MKKSVSMLLLALAGCGQGAAPANQLAQNDFEAVEGWSGDAVSPSLTREKAHSGAYSVAVRPGVDYSMGYTNALGKMSARKPEKIKLTAWVLVPSAQVGTNLVVEVKDAGPGPALLWQGLDLKKEVKKFNEWQQIEKVILIPPAASEVSVFKTYLWRADGVQPVYLDDVTLTLANDEK